VILKVIKSDITQLGMHVGCIANAANESLLGGGGVDGAIHRAAGPKLLEECRTLNGCEPGEAKATKAYNINADYIIHTVGPRYYSNPNPEQTLRNCYRNSLKLADDLGCKSIVFPSISTGVFGYPIHEAAKICVEEVKAFKGHNIQDIYMCVFRDLEFNAYSLAVKENN